MNSNPVVLITGATKGIGRAIVERFAATASELHVVARNQDDLNAMKTALERPGLSVAVYCADLSKPRRWVRWSLSCKTVSRDWMYWSTMQGCICPVHCWKKIPIIYVI